MSYRYKRGNLVWPWLIRFRMTHAIWRPLVAAAARRHARFRRDLAATTSAIPGAAPVCGGV